MLKEDKNMDERAYSDCELHYIDQGFDPARAAEECAPQGESDREKGKFDEDDEGFDDLGGT